MDVYSLVLSSLLFMFLIPGLFFSLPKSGNRYVIAAAHTGLFALAYALTHKSVYRLFYEKKEGFGFNVAPNLNNGDINVVSCPDGSTCPRLKIVPDGAIITPICDGSNCVINQVYLGDHKLCQTGLSCPGNWECNDNDGTCTKYTTERPTRKTKSFKSSRYGYDHTF